MIGIINQSNQQEGLINKNILKVSSLPIFKYVFKLNSLFPPILRKNIVNLANTNRFLPVNCAVDDLEIYQDDNQIYDLLNNPTFYSQNEQSVGGSQLTGGLKKDYDFNFKYPNQQTVTQYQSSDYYDTTRPISISHGQQQYNNVLDSHYNLNIIGMNNYYFNDFKPHQESLDYYSSSNESYISPLDDELFKKRDHEIMETIGDSNYNVEFDLNSEITELSEAVDMPLKFEPKVETDDKKRKLNNTVSTAKKPKLEEEPQDDSELKFECSFCNARFKVKGYLTRHLKKHQSLKAFKCPFYTEEANTSGNCKGTKCHPTGGFSRRDTFKTHLKALHFIYPPGTKSNERSSIGGRCAGCFKFFENNLEWLETHIEKNECTGTVN